MPGGFVTGQKGNDMTGTFVTSDPEHIFALRQMDKFMVGHRGFIAGGCFKNLFSHERIKDIDVFFKSNTDYRDAVRILGANDDFEEAYKSENVTAFRHTKTGTIVELVCSIFGSPEEVISQFDFTVAKFAYYKDVGEDDESTTYKAVYHKEFFEHLHLKRLIIDDKIPKPMSTFERMLRYRKYGYTPCTETKQKLINALRRLPENDVLVPTNFYAGID